LWASHPWESVPMHDGPLKLGHSSLNRPEFRRDSSYWELASKSVAGC
jgi:hypothetical protein